MLKIQKPEKEQLKLKNPSKFMQANVKQTATCAVRRTVSNPRRHAEQVFGCGSTWNMPGLGSSGGTVSIQFVNASGSKFGKSRPDVNRLRALFTILPSSSYSTQFCRLSTHAMTPSPRKSLYALYFALPGSSGRLHSLSVPSEVQCGELTGPVMLGRGPVP